MISFFANYGRMIAGFGSICAFSILWMKTGRSPFVWMSWLGLHLEAIRLQLIASATAAFRHFIQFYPQTYQRVRAETMTHAGGN